EAEFVFLDTASFLPFEQHKTVVCHKDVTGYTEIVKAFGDSLYDTVLIGENIEYINYSGGFIVDTVKRAWAKNKCDGSVSDKEASDIAMALLPFYERLFNTSGILGIQAAYPFNVGDESKYPLDAEPFNNRIRVTYYTTETHDTSLPENGVVAEKQPVVGFDSEFTFLSSADLFVNFGVVDFDPTQTNKTPKQTYDVFGMRSMPELDLHTSWAAPVGLSQILYLRNSLFSEEEHSQFLIEQLIDATTPEGCSFYSEFNNKCRIQDPLKHRQHEVYRLGYLE
ncbi:hypothetical protein SAMN02745724_03209, partial [Pseudoalteromonas denitrificans DSM 6059]